MNPHDLFGMMGGMGGGGMGGMGGMFGGMGGGQMRRRGRDVGVRVPITLEKLYKGGVEEVDLPRTILCTGCKGTGAKSGRSHQCNDCHGRGATIQRRMIGPGMVQQMQVPCETCRGEGTTIQEADKCKQCGGEKTKEVQRTLKAEVEPGMESGAQIPFEEEGDQHPDIDVPGSVVVVLECEDHKVFTREGEDLHIEKTVTLQQALLGLAFELEHLDKRKLRVVAPKGSIITPGMKMVVKGEGMPKEHGHGKGDLVVTFKLEFPRIVDEHQVEQFKANLPKGRKVDTDFDEEPEECFMNDYSPEEWMRAGQFGEDEEEEAEEEGGGPGVTCAHQ